MTDSIENYIGRKRTKEYIDKNPINKYEELINKIDNTPIISKKEKPKEFEVRLLCDILNEDMKKSFSKTV